MGLGQIRFRRVNGIGARCMVKGAPALLMLAGLSRATQIQRARCKVQGISRLDQIRLEPDLDYVRFD